uniref:PfkB family carbohydrate kinase n=1 Tax=Escherichia coli TaxID=562 RepID=UPI000FC1932E
GMVCVVGRIRDLILQLSKSSIYSTKPFDGKKFIHSPAFPAVVKNTAGAGDAFNGSLASGLAKGKSLESALCYASAFASLAVETSNASDMPEHESVIHRIQSIHYQQTIFTH